MPSTLGIVASGEDVFNDAVLWLDTARSVAGETTMVNYGKGGSALNATYGSSAGADTNDPLLLTHTGTNYLYLPGLAGNSVSCTAPGTAVSYAATPVAGGGDTTGAATGGAAFTFSTTGSWSSVRLLNAGGSTVAEFTVNAGNQTALTDSFGVVWALNRASTGRKSVAVVRNVLLFGTDDYLQVADDPLLDFGAGENFTLFAVFRGHGTFVTALPNFIVKAPAAGLAAAKGWSLRANVTTNTLRADVGDGTTRVTATGTTNMLTGAPLNRAAVVVNQSAGTMQNYLNGAADGSSAAITSVGDKTNALPVRAGSPSDAVVGNNDFELVALAVWRRALSTNELATTAARYA